MRVEFSAALVSLFHRVFCGQVVTGLKIRLGAVLLSISKLGFEAEEKISLWLVSGGPRRPHFFLGSKFISLCAYVG